MSSIPEHPYLHLLMSAPFQTSATSACTQEACHVYCVLERYPADAIGQYIACMTMHYAVDVREPLVYLAMNVALEVARFRVLLNRIGGFNVVLDKVIRRAHKSRRHVARHPESCSVVRGSHRYVSVRVHNIMAVEDVGGSDEPLEEVLKSDLLALGEVTCRHYVSER